MTEFHVHEESRGQWGHGQVVCYTCREKGQVLVNKDLGFCVDSLDMLEVNFLLTVAAEHMENNKGHDVRTYTFARSG